MNLNDVQVGNMVELTEDRQGKVIAVFAETGKSPSGKMRKPRLVVSLDGKPSMALRICAGSVVGVA